MDCIGLLGSIAIGYVALVSDGVMLFNICMAATALVILHDGGTVVASDELLLYFVVTILLGSAHAMFFTIRDLHGRARRRWDDARRRAREPWAGLRIVQPRHHGASAAAAASSTTSCSSSCSSSLHDLPVPLPGGRRRVPRPAPPAAAAAAHEGLVGGGGSGRPGAYRPREDDMTQHRASGTMEWRTYVEDAGEDEE